VHNVSAFARQIVRLLFPRPSISSDNAKLGRGNREALTILENTEADNAFRRSHCHAEANYWQHLSQ
jgi:hypothetical protein